MTKAAITPGTQPQIVSIIVIRILPKPLSYTAKGGNIMLRITRQMLILLFLITDKTHSLLG